MGWFAGALVNYLADVLPFRRRLNAPFCQVCEATQKPINYFLWPRRCHACGQRRAWRTWFVEAVFIAGSLGLWLWPPLRLNYWLGMLVLIYFGVVVVIDIEHRLILHPVSLVGVILGLIVGIWTRGLVSCLVGGLVGFGSMFTLYMLGILLVRGLARWRGESGEDEALGFGDVNLSGVLGLMLGWPVIVLGLVLAILLGGAVSLVYLLFMLISRRYRPDLALPYGPFLVASAVILLFFNGVLLAYR